MSLYQEEYANGYVPPSFLELIDSCTFDQKKAMLVALKNSINSDISKRSSAKVDISKYVNHVKGFLPKNYFDEGIVAECSELGLLKEDCKKPKTQWLSSDERDYCFSDNPRFKHAPKDIKKYPQICQLMEMVNRDPRTTGNADSALIIAYNSKSAGIDWHNDGEKLMDSHSSISTVSFGVKRRIEFCNKTSRPRKAEFALDAEHHDLMIMKPGCQEHVLHQVCQADDDQSAKWRFVISFRKLSPFEDITVDPEVSFDKPQAVAADSASPKSSLSNVTLIAGDSFTVGLDGTKLGKGRRGKKTVINLSKSGATIDGVINQLDQYFSSDMYTNVRVNNIFICVGTNDIRNCRENGVRHLKSPLVRLAQHIKLLFPDAVVWFQCIIPLPLQHEYSVQNVEQFNALLYEVCIHNKTYFLDVFEDFLCYDYISDSFYRDEYYYVDTKNIHLNKRGLITLAKSYKRKIHSNRIRFNPLGY